MVVLCVGMVPRLYDLDATAPVFDEPLDILTAMRQAQGLNPFDVPLVLRTTDPSQSRLPYTLAGLSIRALSRVDAEAFFPRAGRVEAPPDLARCVLGVAIGVVCLLLAWYAPPSLGRWSGLVPLGFALVAWSILGWPVLPMNQIVAARVSAALVGGLGLWATFALGREFFGPWGGLYAAASLALSPMSIGWNRTAVTTGDAFVSAFFTLSVWLLYRCVRSGSGRAVAACAAAFGLAFAAKISAVLLWPIAVIYVLASWWARRRSPDRVDPSGKAADFDRRIVWLTLLNVGLLGMLAIVFFWPAMVGEGCVGGRFAVWIAALVVYVLGVAWLCRSDWRLPAKNPSWLIVNLCVGGAVVAGFATPYHLRMEVISGLSTWWHEAGARAGYAPDYTSDLASLIKLTLIHTPLPVGMLAVGGLFWGGRRSNRHWWGLLALVLAVYLLTVAALHHKATFYVMPLLPLVHVLGAGAAVGLFGRLRRTGRVLPATFAGVLVVFLIGQVQHVVRIHPHYLFDKLGWDRRLISNARFHPPGFQPQGARMVVEWLADNAAPGARVAVFMAGGPSLNHRIVTLKIFVTLEIQRSTRLMEKGITLNIVTDPGEIGSYQYVCLLDDYEKCRLAVESVTCVLDAVLQGERVGTIYRRTPPR